MNKKIEDLITACQYWSSRYAASSHVSDLQKKTNILNQLKEEAHKQGISNEEIQKLISR